MKPRFQISSYVLVIGLAVGVGLTSAFWLEKGANLAFGRLSSLADVNIVSRSYFTATSTAPTSTAVMSPSYISEGEITIPDQGKFILADLGKMSLILYQDGNATAEYPIATRGKPGTAWETPVGSFQILSKEASHFSSIGKVYMPYSLEFQGNYFIHGWTYYPNGQLVSADFSGGCLKFKTADAKKIFDFADIGTPVVVMNSDQPVANGHSVVQYVVQTDRFKPNLSASSYLVADLDSGEVIMEKNSANIMPIASITKLMTALVTLDTVNFFNYTTVPASALVAASSTAKESLKAGDKLMVKDLLYPLLLESSNAAAMTLSGLSNRNTFISQMNDRAAALGLSSMTFDDPSGESWNDKASAADLFRFARHLYYYKPYIFDITKLSDHSVGSHHWLNSNRFATEPNFIGGKEGINTAAKENFVNIFSIPMGEYGNREIAVILLGSDHVNQDTADVLDILNNEVSISKKQNLFNAGAVVAALASAPSSRASSAAPAPTVVATSTSLVFVGDIMLDRGVKDSITTNGKGDYHYIIDDISKIRKADILVGNLEGPASDQGTNDNGGFSFRMSPDALSLLKDIGFNVLTTANNHMGDWGRPAFEDTLARIKALGMVTAGGGQNYNEAAAPQVVVRNGIRFGFLAFTDVGPGWLTAKDQWSGMIMASDKRVPQIIKDAAAEVDVLTVSYHFGTEYQKIPNGRQKELAHMAIDNGAKLVIGTHPHVPETMEQYNNGLIFYSLGNFIFDQHFSPDTMSGSVVKIDFNGKNVSDVWKMQSVQDRQYRVRVE